MLSRRSAGALSILLVAALGSAVIVASSLGTTGGASPGRAQAPAPRPDVVIVGESLVRQVAPIETQLVRRSGMTPTVAAHDGVDLASPFVQSQVHQAIDRGTPIVVLATAANDAYHGAGTAPRAAWAPALARYRRTLSSTLAALSHQCTVLVDTRVTATSTWYGLARIGPAIDGTLDASAHHGAGPVEVVRWSALSAAHGSDWFWTDGLHFGDPDRANTGWHPAGAAAFAAAIASGIEACAADLRVHPRRAPLSARPGTGQ